ncbi:MULTISPECIES: hypothetical protein [Methylobacteriaceae]|uniref:Uncharacterized protein n=2 Tax=Methylobacteriaceae TaxID=119045 RepID=A0AA37HSG0_9HYPH|nr:MULTISPECIES: hypothetical protein [Methylobacteriaceae]MDQ0520115.1 hypothetical protein [Methylobacterium gregans]BAU90596.1 hypothetical protein MPPM_1991 [Methylorubrum populi]GJD81267.1 hypothetical protein NBEOAGPD_4513 [Methylobacterium gregans]GLS52519.1 hypothetical protein GCM10007886_07020 [Methylobacterium gregans]
MPEVYRNRTRCRWSVRISGRVVGRRLGVVLVGVTFRASEAARLRCLRTGARDVHARAAGTVADLPRPEGVARLRYRVKEAGFRVERQVVTRARAVWFEVDGSAWAVGGE